MATASKKDEPAAASGETKTEREKLFEKVKKEIRSILQTAAKTGLSPDALERDYKDLNGRPIPIHALGFATIFEALDAMNDAVEAYDLGHDILLFAKSTASTAHLERLIAKAKPSKLGRFGGIIQQPAVCRRGTPERRKLIEKRLIEVASEFPGFVSYYDLYAMYQQIYLETLDSKSDFNCQAKALFTIKLAHAFDVKAREGSGSFSVRLKAQFRKEPTSTANGFASHSATNILGAGGFNPPQPPVPTPPVQPPLVPTPPLQTQPLFLPPHPTMIRFPSAPHPMTLPFPVPPYQVTLPFPIASHPVTLPFPIAPHPMTVPFQLGPPQLPYDYLRFFAPATLLDANATPFVPRQDANLIRAPDVASLPPPDAKLSRAPDVPSLPPPDELFMDENLPPPARVEVVAQSGSGNGQLEHQHDLDRRGIESRLESFTTAEAPSATIDSKAPPRAKTPPRVKSPQQDKARLLEALKESCALVLSQYPNGIPYMQFSKAYRNLVGRELEMDFEPHNFLSVSEVCDYWPDLIVAHPDNNGGYILFDKRCYENFQKPKGLVSSAVAPKGPVSSPVAPATVEQWAQQASEASLIDDLWRVVMKLPNRSLLYSELPLVYERTMGKAFPVPKQEQDDFGLRLFDYTDRFKFSYDANLADGMRLTARPDYEDPRKEIVNAAQGQDNPSKYLEYVQFGESFQLQPLPVSSEQLVSLDNSDPVRFFQVLMHQIHSPVQFYFQLHSAFEAFEKLCAELNEYFTNAVNSKNAVVPLADVKVDLVCVCFSDDDGMWCRAVIRKVHNLNDITVLFVDFGTEVNVALTNIRYLPRRFFTFPSQAIEARMAALSPPGNDWPLEAGELMASLCGDSILWAELYKIGEDGVPHVFLTLSVDDTETHISDVLINANVAVFNDLEIRIDGLGSNVDQLRLEQEIASPVKETPANWDECNGTASGANQQESVEDVLDMGLDMQVMNELSRASQEGTTDVQIFYTALSYFCRRRLAVNNVLAKLNDEATTRLAVDCLAWLEKQIDWLRVFCDD